jgi:hypothetical protein
MRVSYGAERGALIALSVLMVSGCASNGTVPAPTGASSFDARSAQLAGPGSMQAPDAANQSNPPNLDIPTPSYYDNGITPSISIGASGTFVEEHESGTSRLWYHVGRLSNGALVWGGSHDFDNGVKPSIAANASNDVVEVHESNGLSTNMWYHVGKVTSSEIISWGSSVKYDTGALPAVAISGDNAIEVHQSSSLSDKLWYHVGIVNAGSKKIDWGPSVNYDNGWDDSVGLNASNVVVEVHDSSSFGKLWYHVGILDRGAKRINWGSSVPIDGTPGNPPHVALNNAGGVVVVYQGCDGICTLRGSVDAGARRINWQSPTLGTGIATSTNPMSIAMNNDYAAINMSANGALYSAFSLETDRANWMGDRLGTLGSKPLSKIVFPGSHDAGVYEGSLGPFGITQDQNLYQQLSWGVRYFDLRPDANLNIYHGPVTGPSVQTVLNDVKKYMDEGHREVVILKFSHFDFDTNTSPAFTRLLDMISNTLGTWLYVNDTGKRLADIPLNTMLSKGKGVVLAVLDVASLPSGRTNEYTYRDWNTGSKENPPSSAGDLSVYDQYSNTTDYNKMKSDQLDKFANFNGKMQWNANLPTDMFLLSWTLTPCCLPKAEAPIADAQLGPVMATVNRNRYGLIPNVLYVDFVEWADPAGVAIAANARF